jgi:hypothetical protein
MRLLKNPVVGCIALLVFGLTLLAAQDKHHALGTTASGFLPPDHPAYSCEGPPFGDCFLDGSWSNASYATGGVALRNRASGYIQISGLPAGSQTQAAYLYWAVLAGPNTTKTQLKDMGEVSLCGVEPKTACSGTLHGTLLNIGGDPCWGSVGTYVYKVAVSATVAKGNGAYLFSEFKSAYGLTDGEDPWDGNVVFPAWEGASLVIVGTGGASVGLIDGQAGTTFSGGSPSYSNFYQLPATVGTDTTVLLDNFGYDGQLGTSRFADIANEQSFAEGWPSLTNNIQFAGWAAPLLPGLEATDSDWDGSSGWALPQLWDDTGHDISNAFESGDTWVLVQYNSFGDCIGTVGAVLSVN